MALHGGGDAGIGDLGTIPVPAIPDGDNYSTSFIPVGIKSSPSPSPNGRILRRESGIGSPLPSLVPTDAQYADVLTKGLPIASFESFRTSLCVVNTKHQTEGGVVLTSMFRIDRSYYCNSTLCMTVGDRGHHAVPCVVSRSFTPVIHIYEPHMPM